MADQYYANYRLLAGAIVAEQCRDYYEIYRRAVKDPSKRRRGKQLGQGICFSITATVTTWM